MTTKGNILLSCGGTGGHVYPLIAVAQVLQDLEPIFVGTSHRRDADIIPKYGFQYLGLPSQPSRLLSAVSHFVRALGLMRRYRPKALLCSGGFFTVPISLAAYCCRVPIILLEQNVVPGRANRFLQKFAQKICVSFEKSAKQFDPKKTVVTGNPIRSTFLEDEASRRLQKTKLSEGPTLLVFGGSQGAKSINTLLHANHTYFLEEKLNLIHITGEAFFAQQHPGEPIKELKNKQGKVKIVILPYIENMKAVYNMATVVVSRAGATSIAELLQFKKPAVLIPYPYATDDHQKANALAMVDMGMAELLDQNDLNFDTLLKSLSRLKAKESVNGQENAAQSVRAVVEELSHV